MTDQTARVLLFSDDADTRKAVIEGVGARASKDTPPIEWVEKATKAAVVDAVANEDFAALVLDGEATKEGGMSISRELHGTFEDLPPVIVLIARQQDEWLATSFGADATIPDPLDPIVLQETLAATLSGDL